MGPEALAQVLRPLQNLFRADQYPNLLVGLEVSDDAAVYKINDAVSPGSPHRRCSPDAL